MSFVDANERKGREETKRTDSFPEDVLRILSSLGITEHDVLLGVFPEGKFQRLVKVGRKKRTTRGKEGRSVGLPCSSQNPVLTSSNLSSAKSLFVYTINLCLCLPISLGPFSPSIHSGPQAELTASSRRGLMLVRGIRASLHSMTISMSSS